MKKLFIIALFIACNYHENKINDFLRHKKNIEIIIDTLNARDARFRSVTGYNEIYDSIEIDKQYPHQELVDSIRYIKEARELLKNELEKTKYSIDSLSKLK